MGFLKKLFSSKPAQTESPLMRVQVKCKRCGEIIEGHVNLANDLSLNDSGDKYFVRKVLMGNGRCFQQVEVELTFDLTRKLLDKQAVGGAFVE